jgi:hypothetical protein
MAWKKLNINDLRLVLSEDEVEKLNELSIDASITQILNDTIELVSGTWRGALRAKGMEIDPRDGYTPSAYWYWILVHARYACWSRFPNSSVFGIDDVRKDEVKRAMELLKNPYIDVDPVDWTDPDLSAYQPSLGSQLTTPWLRFPTEEPVIKNFTLPVLNYDIH